MCVKKVCIILKKENNEEKSTFIYFVVGIGFDGGTGF